MTSPKPRPRPTKRTQPSKPAARKRQSSGADRTMLPTNRTVPNRRSTAGRTFNPGFIRR